MGSEMCIRDSPNISQLFVENRSILDKVLLPFEIIHHIKSKQKGKIGEVALKIDIGKFW